MIIILIKNIMSSEKSTEYQFYNFDLTSNKNLEFFETMLLGLLVRLLRKIFREDTNILWEDNKEVNFCPRKIHDFSAKESIS